MDCEIWGNLRYYLLLVCFVSAAAWLRAEAVQTRLNVPEPMVFDLVRPLGAERGELEVNILAKFQTDADAVPRALEVEYAFADDHSIELEFPVAGSRLYQYNAALQGTFGTFAREQGIHSWQVTGRLARGGSGKSATRCTWQLFA
jgi:hypothetical protein